MNRLPTLELVRLFRDLGGNPKLKKPQPYWWKPVNSSCHLETQNPFQISQTVKEKYFLEGRGGLVSGLIVGITGAFIWLVGVLRIPIPSPSGSWGCALREQHARAKTSAPTT